ncbi:hypothetical protein LSAT2_002844, partial [Lamellibrachia satsuma]
QLTMGKVDAMFCVHKDIREPLLPPTSDAQGRQAVSLLDLREGVQATGPVDGILSFLSVFSIFRNHVSECRF